MRFFTVSDERAARVSVFYATCLIGLFVRQRAWPEGYTGRLLKNEFIEKWHGQEEKLKVLRADELAKVEAASRVGDYDIANVTVGESIGMIHDLPQAGDVVRRVVDEAVERLARYAPGSQKLPHTRADGARRSTSNDSEAPGL